MIVTDTNADQLYIAILGRDSQYDDTFFFAVTSTGIYCRPSCPARRPLRKNCHFFQTAKEAEQHGFRACKRCHPHQPKTDIAAALLQELSENSLTNTDSITTHIATTGLGERQLRRLVKDRTNNTPAQLYRTKRLQEAYRMVRQTDLPIVDIAFRANFGSVRQFTSAFKQHYCLTPGQARKRKDNA